MSDITVYAQIGERIRDTGEKIRRELSRLSRYSKEGDEIVIRVVIGKEPVFSSHCERPPLGLVPRFIWKESRRDEIVAAMNRYAAAGRHIPTEWIEEYNCLVENSR